MFRVLILAVFFSRSVLGIEGLFLCPELIFDNGTRSRFPTHEAETISKLPTDRPTLVVVDGLSAGAEYSVLGRKMFPRMNIIHVQTAAKMSPGLISSFNPASYDANIVYTPARLNHLARLLAPFRMNTLRVVAGTETSPRVRTLLTDALSLPGTSAATSNILGNKYLAAQAVSPYVKTIGGNQFTDAQAAWDWAQSQNFLFPMMVKPVDAAGSFGVTAVKSKDEFFRAFRKILGRWNPLGIRSTAMLVQPYISRRDFTEYVIDAVVNPEHGASLAECLVYNKEEIDGLITYRTTRLLHLREDDPLYSPFINVADGVAKAYQMVDGVLHIEVFVKNGTYPPEIYFIEAGARPGGGGIPALARAAGAYDSISLHLLSMFSPDEYARVIEGENVPTSHGIQVELLGPPIKGLIGEVPTEDEFRQRIPGFHSASLHLKAGHWAGPAQDLFEGPGVIDVVGSEQIVDGAEASVRDWEASGDLYRFRTPRWRDYIPWPWR